jgi:putative adhesin/cell wall-active antibiotic response 4TMS protein YvqF
MGNYPPPPYPPPPGPPYGNDWKYQRRVLKDQARVQRDMLRAQREAYRYQTRSLRRSSILGPLVLITVGIIFLLVQTGRLQGYRLWEWYGRFWPFLLVGAGVVMLLEWAYDQHAQSDPTQPRYRRRVGGGVFTLLVLLAFTGVVLSGVREGGHTKLFNGWNINQDNWDEFMGDKHESDQTLAQAFPAGATLLVNNPRGDVTVSGTSDDNQIHVSVHKEVYTRSDSDAEAKAQRLSPNINGNGNNVVLNVPALEGARADLTITVPATAATTVTANHGNVKITAIKAPVIITANHGDIELSAITGDITTRINNSGSDLSAHSVTGSLTVEGHSHDSTISDLSGPLTMRGEFFGDAHFERIRGPIKFHTSRTDFQLARLDGQIDISSSAALSTSEAVGPLTLTTHSRNITLDRISGDVSVTNRNGSVDITCAPPLSNVTVENRNGSVSITVPEGSSFAYQFDATNGDIQSDFPQIKSTEEDSRKNAVSGTIGKGGPLLRVTTSQGDISLKKASIMPLPPMPPMPPKLTALPPEARQSIEDAKQATREATAAAREAAKEAAAAAKEAARETKQQSKHPDQ